MMNAAIPGPVEVEVADGLTLTVHPITARNWADFGRWYNKRTGAAATKLVSMDVLAEAAETLEGMAWIAWKSLSPSEPSLTQDGTLDRVGSLEGLAAVVRAAMGGGGGEDRPTGDPAASPTGSN